MKKTILILMSAVFCVTSYGQGVEDRATLITHANTALPDNTTRQIKPVDIRNMVKSLANSTYNKVSDVSITLDTLKALYGFEPPRYTTAEREAIDASLMAEGFLVFDTDENKFYCSDGASWQTVAGVTPGGDVYDVQFNSGANSFAATNNFQYQSDQLVLGVSGGGNGIRLYNNSGGYYSDLIFNNGGSTNTLFSFPPDNGTNGYFLQTDGSGVTSWASAGLTIGDAVSGYVSNGLLYTNVSGDLSTSSGITFDGTNLNLGAAVYATDVAVKHGDGGVAHFQMPAGAGTLWYQLPGDDGDAGEVLTSDGSGNLTWATAAGTPAGSDTQIQYNNGGVFGASSGLTYSASWLRGQYAEFSNAIVVGKQGVANGGLSIANTSNANSVGIAAPTVSSSYSIILPPAQGSSGDVLVNDGSGNMSWEAGVGNCETYCDTFHLTSYQILNGNSSPKLLIADPGAGKFIEIISASYFHDFQSAEYGTATNIQLYCNGSTEPVCYLNNILDATSDVITKFDFSTNGFPGNITLCESEAIYFRVATTDPVDGDCTGTVYVQYRIVTL